MDQLILAPLRGITGRTFREVYARHFNGISEAVAPFIPTVEGVRIKPRLLYDVQPPVAGPPLVPQLLSRDPRALRVMLEALRGLGYTRVNLNAGCPWPMVVKRGRGSGLLADETILAGMLEAGCDAMPGGFSIKVRLGINDASLLPLRMPLINQFPLEEVVIHPRTAKQMYEGTADVEAFERVAAMCCHNVVYNGDIFSRADFQRMKERFPHITRWMLGRGVIRNPQLCEDILAGADSAVDVARVMAFHDDYFAAVCGELSGERPVLGRMKELWYHLHSAIPRGGKILRHVQLCNALEDYRMIVAEVGGR